MPDIFCRLMTEAMTDFFKEEVIGGREKEILQRLIAGESLPTFVHESVKEVRQFRRQALLAGTNQVVENWPLEHHEMIRSALMWALQKRVQGAPVKVTWKGDDEHTEFVTKIEIKGDELVLDFAHPPAVARRKSA